jgi:hypothetical protein
MRRVTIVTSARLCYPSFPPCFVFVSLRDRLILLDHHRLGALADLTTQISDFTRINHDHDPIPTVPGRFLGFQHPAGEVHIVKNGPTVLACAGL